MRRLDPNLDFSKIIDPLLADQGPAFALVPKLMKQLDRMKKIRDGLPPTPSVLSPALVTPSVPAPEYMGPPNRDRPAQSRDSRHTGNKRVLPESSILVPDTQHKRVRRVSRDIVVPEILPALGPLKRYANMEEAHYHESLELARWCFDRMLDQAGGPQQQTMQKIQYADPAPPVERDKIRGFFTNRSLQWETSKKFDLGLEMSILNGRFNVGFDWFLNDIDNLVLGVPTPPTAGIPGNSISQNIGTAENRGIELTIGGDIIRSKDFNWNLSVNYTNVENKIKSLYTIGGTPVLTIPGSYNNIEVGQSLNYLY
jgi:hypothetical protein